MRVKAAILAAASDLEEELHQVLDGAVTQQDPTASVDGGALFFVDVGEQ
jgi:hypothetical protein